MSRKAPWLGGLWIFAALMPANAQTVVKEVPSTPATQDTGPIISDSDFNAALPSLEPAAPAPAATTTAPDGTQKLVPSTQTAPATATAPVPTTDATQATMSGLPAVVAPEDADLSSPLPPLSGFNTQPLANVEIPATTAPLIAYDVTVDGLKETGQFAKFKALSALEGGKGKAANTGMVRARANEDEALILRLLTSQGYYDGTVATTVSNGEKGSGRVQAHITVSPGKRYNLGDIHVAAQPTTPPDLILDAMTVKTGDPIVADDILASEANVSLVLPQNGYPFAKVNLRDIVLDPATLTGDYNLPVDTGPRARFGGFKTDGKLAFRESHVAVLTRFKRDDIYDSRKVDDLRQALVATSLFRSVAVEPVRTDEKALDGSEYVDLVVHQQAGPSRTLAAELGYSTGEGAAATGSWTARNLFPPEGALTVTAAIGTQQQSLGFNFHRSNDKRRDRTTSIGLLGDHTVYAAYEAYTTTVSYSVSRVSTPLWQKLWTWSYGADLVTSQESTGVLNAQGKMTWKTYLLADTPVKIGYDKTDDLLNPSKGYRLTGQFTPVAALGGTGSTSARIVLDGSYYVSVSPKIVIASRARIGSIFGASLLNIAPSRRLYAGGGGSVRGFTYQGLGPVDAAGDPTGGRSVTELSAELRYRIGNYGIVPFIDAGQVYNTTMPQFSDLRVGFGVGARLYTNFGPVRIDFAMPVDKKKKDTQFALYVGIGQAF